MSVASLFNPSGAWDSDVVAPLPNVKAVDGIPVLVTVRSTFRAYTLQVSLRHGGLDSVLYTSPVEGEAPVVSLFERMQDLRFNAFLGLMEDEQMRARSAVVRAPIRETYAGLSFFQEECCICFETTLSLTRCDHPLCVPCLLKVNKAAFLCPCCREPLSSGWS